jgi:hypothetical protein
MDIGSQKKVVSRMVMAFAKIWVDMFGLQNRYEFAPGY